MSDKFLPIAALVSTVLVASVVFIDQASKGNLGNRGNSRENWQWADQWNQKEGRIIPRRNEVTPPNPDKQPTKPELPRPQEQLTTKNYNEALKMASDRNMKIVLYLHAGWCQWCKKMDSESFPDAKVREALKNYVFADINADENRPIANKYGVQGIPAVIIIDAQEKVVKKANFMDAKKLAGWLGS